MLKARPRARKLTADRVAKPAPARRQVAATHQEVCLGVLVAWDDKGPVVDFEGNTRGPLRARVAGGASRVRALRPGTTPEVVVLVDGRGTRPPVLLGVLHPLEQEGTGADDIDARVDGRRIELQGRDEVVLRCGEATITMRRNGRITIRGVQVETRATGVNRIRGGSVAIN